MESFVPAFLTRMSAHLWEITDEDDLEIAQLDWDGDKGVENLMGIYIQHPSQNFINYFQTHPSTAVLSSIMSQDQHEVSPYCAGLRKHAAGKLELRAKSMKAVAMKKSVGKIFEVGEVALVPLGHSTMVPVPILAFWYFSSVSVWHGTFLVLAVKIPVPIEGICASLFCINNNTIIERLQY